MTKEVLVAFRAASAGYGGTAVVTGASFDVSAGEIVGLVGPNAAGKSTLLRAVSGAAEILDGEVHVRGRDVRALTPAERARLVGVVPQTPPVAFAFSARAFVEMGRNPHLGRLQSPRHADRAIVAEVMRLTDTERLADQAVNTLSGGDLQRLTLAQALAQEPRVLLLDEATAHLDLNHALQVLDLVRERADDGTGVLAVFHDLDLAARYSDRIAVVTGGRVVPPLPPGQALTADVVSSVFDVRAVVRTEAVTGTVAVVPILRGADVGRARLGPVGVVGGSGAAAALLRRLALAGVRTVCGALNEGDVDHAVAVALGVERIDLPPFGEVDAVAEERVRTALATTAGCVVCGTPFGRANAGNLRAAVAAGVPLVLVGDMGPERDYSGGAATTLWQRALAAGAVQVPDDDAAVAWALELLEEVGARD